MIAELALPRLGETMETGRVVAWLKQPGQRFLRGETLVEIESDKTVVEMPALADGTLLEILVPEGHDAEVGAPLCRYDDGGTSAPQTAQPQPAVAAESPPAPVALTPAPAGSRLRATPLARSIARQNGLALDGIAGTGRRGRVEADDVRATLTDATDGPTIAVPGGHVAYREWGAPSGERDSLVLLHGLAGDSQVWVGLAALLARAGAHMLAPDLPGHGTTSVAATTLDALAETIAAFLRAAAPRPVHLVGHSLGAAVAARIARAAPDRVTRLTLLAPAGLDRAIDRDFIGGVVAVRTGGALSHLLRRLTVRPAELSAAQLEAMAASLAQGRLLALADAMIDSGGQAIDITQDLRAAKMPVRIIWGLRDKIIPWTQASAAGHRAAIHLLADSGHVPQWDQPAEVAALLV